MGSFLLYDKSAGIDEARVLAVHERKGFAAPERVDLGSHGLLFWPKQLVDDPGQSSHPSGARIFIDGTLIYRGLGIVASRERLLADIIGNQLDRDQLVGSFCAIVHHEGRIQLLLDSMHIYHLFVNDARTLYSSSFLGMLAATTTPFPLNREALIENLTLGWITGPDTLVHGVQVVGPTNEAALSSGQVAFINNSPDLSIDEFATNRKEAMEECVETLRAYFRQLDGVHAEFGADLGLSGGYDSRLLFGLALERWDHELTLHTHGTKGVHTTEKAGEKVIADHMAEMLGFDLHTVYNPKPADMDGEMVERNLDDSLFYFDGRTNHCMGNYHATNTRRYRVDVLTMDRRFGINGLTGEILRNRDENLRSPLPFSTWLMNNEIYPDAIAGIRSKRQLMSGVLSRVRHNTAEMLGIDDNVMQKATLYRRRRFLGELKNRYNYALKANAEHQLAFFLMPYSEAPIIRAAYRATPHIGLYGDFQGQMIKAINADLGRVNYSLGYPIERESLKFKLRRLIFANTPLAISILKRNRAGYLAKGEAPYVTTMASKTPLVRENLERITSLYPEENFTAFYRRDLSFDLAVYMGAILGEFEDKIRLG